MKCEKCQEEKLKSSVHADGFATTTLMASQPEWWDEEGEHHPAYNPNTVTQGYSCSNGHSWSISL